jgi:diguanylate cyclase (GGDEF)-like protein
MSSQSSVALRWSLEKIASMAGGAEPAEEVRPHILIVDDVEDNRILLRRRFERQGFEITEADGGIAALELIERQDFDAVLLDFMMPDLDGVEVLRQVRRTRPSAILPVIMVTARTQSEDLVHALNAGADDYITKPVDFQVALARVKTQIARRKAELRVLEATHAVQKSNEVLEDRVNERTAQLLEINEQLQKEIVQREKSEAKTKYLAHHDALTGLANRVLFREVLTREMEQLSSSSSLSILFIDLDGFKSVNDTLGHSVGDQLLKTISTRLRDLLPDEDCIARFGGDEFAILQIGKEQPKAAASLAIEVIQAVNQICEVEGHEVTVGASIGITFCSNKSESIGDLLRNADLAMYRAKSEGRGSFRFFDPEMDRAAQARRQLELDMRRALLQGDFRLDFQPIVNLQAKRIVSMEALLRWTHPVNGPMSPADFVPVAEETGLIVPLGEWVIREACKQAMSWPEDVRVAVNLSPTQFSRGNIVTIVINALASTGLPSSRLELEITESVILEKTERNVEILNQLRNLGIRISMDDFGTGYSSLGYLRSFRFDKIKIDQCFVRDMSSDQESRAIIAAIAGLGTSFGMVTTAEGVETLEQLRIVASEGCTEVQGKFFSMAVRSDEVNRLIESISPEHFPAQEPNQRAAKRSADG